MFVVDGFKNSFLGTFDKKSEWSDIAKKCGFKVTRLFTDT